MKKRRIKLNKGFTLIEILLVIGIIAILATIVIVAINPARQFAQARNSQRTANVTAILNAIGQNIADNRGIFTCATGSLPQTATVIKSGSGGFDLANCISPIYISSVPFDPSALGAHFTSNSDYDTGYTVAQDALTRRITIAAPEALQAGELAQDIKVTR